MASSLKLSFEVDIDLFDCSATSWQWDYLNQLPTLLSVLVKPIGVYMV